MARKLELLPAVDVAGGQAVRLVQGAAGSETSYGDPLDAALAWQNAGAEWIHLVDLDAAFGRGSNRELLADVIKHMNIKVELSGGIRDDESLDAAMNSGCTRVNLGTAALENPDWCAKAIDKYGDRIAVGLDVRGTTLAARGWTEDGGDLWEVLERLERDGCSRYVVTDVTKDGTLKGPNLELLQQMCERTDKPIVASGGVSSLEDLRAIAALTEIGVEGAIVGKALYEGRCDVAGARLRERDQRLAGERSRHVDRVASRGDAVDQLLEQHRIEPADRGGAVAGRSGDPGAANRVGDGADPAVHRFEWHDLIGQAPCGGVGIAAKAQRLRQFGPLDAGNGLDAGLRPHAGGPVGRIPGQRRRGLARGLGLCRGLWLHAAVLRAAGRPHRQAARDQCRRAGLRLVQCRHGHGLRL